MCPEWEEEAFLLTEHAVQQPFGIYVVAKPHQDSGGVGRKWEF